MRLLIEYVVKQWKLKFAMAEAYTWNNNKIATTEPLYQIL